MGASELFGHRRGAFTGATNTHRGLFEQAHGGTLFLDEIGDLAVNGQAQLLRVIEYGDLRALGAEQSRRVDVRVVCATHRDLGDLVAAKHFRADLAYRLGVLVIRVPPLRERLEDIPLLGRHLLARQERNLGPKCLASDALDLLVEHPWPGNVRQLSSVLLRAAMETDGATIPPGAIAAALDADPLADRSTVDTSSPRHFRTVASIEAIRAALDESGGRVAAAAKRLGIARSTLRDHMARHGIANAG
jgi:DNA-binding NtrC family response regulator